eukprot:XP_011669423.1 PREDICTED: craniofacial development protein 2-like [Strongylocentrotus purpuratus]
MEVHTNSTRVKAPAFTNLPTQPVVLQEAVNYDATARKPNGGVATEEPPTKKAPLLTTKKQIGIGTWNVRTLLQAGSLDILLHQLKGFRWEIIGIAETHWTDMGDFTHDGHRILCSGKDKIHREGVALILNKTAQNALLGYNPISPRIISARFEIQTGSLTIIQVYAPNTANSEEEIEEFYNLLQATIEKAPRKDILIVMGDLNAKVGSDSKQWNQVIGQYGLGEANPRGEKLLNFCAANDLIITNTLYKQSKGSRQWTWESPDQNTHNKIDFIMINKNWKNSISNARSFPSADVGSDHQLIITNLRLKLKAKPRPQYLKRYDVFRLKDPKTRTDYEIEIGGKFGPLLGEDDTDVENLWKEVKTAINETSQKVLGLKKSKQQEPWINEEVLRLSDERKEAKQDKQRDPNKRPRYNFLNREIRRKTKGCKDKWIQDLCKKVETSRQATKSKAVYTTIKQITKKSSIRMQAVKSKDGEILTEMKDVKERWKESFEELYNHQNQTNGEATNIPQMASLEPVPDILRDEVEFAVRKLAERSTWI